MKISERIVDLIENEGAAGWGGPGGPNPPGEWIMTPRGLVEHIRLVGRAERDFPMQGGPPVPWWMAERIYELYVRLYGNIQTLERIAERGGFGWAEVEWMWTRTREGNRFRRREG